MCERLDSGAGDMSVHKIVMVPTLNFVFSLVGDTVLSK